MKLIMTINNKKNAADLTSQSNQFPLFHIFPRPKTQADSLKNIAPKKTGHKINLKILSPAIPVSQPGITDSYLKIAYIKPEAQTSKRVQQKKRIFDLIFAVTAITLGFPVLISVYLITKSSSRGPAIYKQERVGRNHQLFYIYKFRSMKLNAEPSGPQLSREHDPRITKWGRIMRRTHLDELPQFWNVLKGDMAIVGPRPERIHFINKIMEINSDYKKLHSLRPGLTSMGQVHFGYAENVDQMCERMHYDLNYMNKMNLRTDLKIIIQTIKVMVQCKGK